MTGKKIDNDASLGRAQLAERMRKTILSALGEQPVDSGSNTQSGNEINPQTVSSSDMLLDVEREISPSYKTNDSLLSSVLPNSETLPNSGLTSSETLPSSGLTSSETLPSSGLTSSETLPSSGLTGSETLPSSDSLPVELVILSSSDSKPNSETLLNETLPNSETLPVNPLLGSVSLPIFEHAPYGQPIPEDLFFHTLDKGIYELLSADNASASILFYWAFTQQKRTILFITYSLVVSSLHFARTRISRTLDRIRESQFFSVKTTPKGIFIDLSPLLADVMKTYPQLASPTGSGSLPHVPLVVSSSIYKTTTTNYKGSDPLPVIEKIELQILVDVMSFFGFTEKDINPKVINTIHEIYPERGITNIAYNLVYTKNNMKSARSVTAYLLKALTEDYGGTSLTFEDRGKTDKLIEVFRKARNSKLDNLGLGEIREMLFVLRKTTADGTSRSACDGYLSEILNKSTPLMEKFSEFGAEKKTGLNKQWR